LLDLPQNYKQMKPNLTVFFILFVIIIISCRYDKREIASPTITTKVDSCQDTVHFSTQINPILVQSCELYGCHVGSGGGPGAYDYTVFANVQMEDSAIYSRITMNPSNTGVGGYMPKSGTGLTQAQIQLFYCWWKQGGQDN
jgi:hypothetical protein